MGFHKNRGFKNPRGEGAGTQVALALYIAMMPKFENATVMIGFEYEVITARSN